jgi:hypothetical protein
VTNKALTTYLNDHLAGSVAALELLDHLIQAREGVDPQLLTALQGEIREDQQVVERLLQDLGGKASTARKAAAWLAEKLGQAKLRIDEAGGGELRTLEALETLALGIQGKLSLWRSLESVRTSIPQVAALDLPRLQAQATNQFTRVERLRLQAARRALAG